MNQSELNQQLGYAFQLIQTGKKEFFSGFDQAAKIAAYEKMNFGYELIINYKNELNDQIPFSIYDLEIEEYKKQLIKLKQLLLLHNQQNKDEISDISQKLPFEMDFILVNEKLNIQEDQILQLPSIKNIMKEIALPFRFPQIFQNNYHLFDKILIYGPPNSGKKYLIKYCTSVANATLITLSISQLINKQFDKPSCYIKQIFNFAKQKQPSILLIYDLDQISHQNLNIDRTNLNIFVELLIELDKQRRSDSLTFQIIGITSYPWNLDPPVRRRFAKRIYVPLPNHEQIVDLLKQKLSNMKINITQEQFVQLTNLFEGYTCCDISNILQMSYDQAVNINKQNIKIKVECTENIVKYDDILHVLKKYKKTISQNYINKLEEWKATFDD
ncbi:unnamed protein product [Paramecium pentaurelia]|uniref:AAA+ ATPase domain-containing protein n=1 Tax=Paramecium pentaurelia TaxID=43138 RepID=A0A8S1SR32_9CILI|nr:unnamed protein product [Paramecium pentaurelia]